MIRRKTMAEIEKYEAKYGTFFEFFDDRQQLDPPELLRKGRLDEIFYVDLPGEEERGEIFRIHLSKRGRDAARFDVGALADAAEDYSGAEIEEAINSALYDAFGTGADIQTGHVLNALGQTVPLAVTMDEQINHLRAWADGRARNAIVPRPMKPRGSAGQRGSGGGKA